jgi:hypothetical protein
MGTSDKVVLERRRDPDAPVYVSGPDTSTKIGQIVERYGLHDFRDSLPERWRGENGYEEMGFRKISDVFNARLLLEKLKENQDGRVFDRTAWDYYNRLTSDDEETERKAREELKQIGVDLDALENDFVSHQSIHRYVTNKMGVSKDSGYSPKQTTRAETLNQIRSRTQRVLKEHVENGIEDETIALTDPAVDVEFKISCRECGESYDVDTIFGQKYCECFSTER